MMFNFFTGILLYQLMLLAIIAIFSFIFMERNRVVLKSSGFEQIPLKNANFTAERREIAGLGRQADRLPDKTNKENYYRIGIIAICYSAFFVMRILPGIFNIQIFTMPWLSRIFSITSIIVCYFLFRKQFAASDYFNSKPDKNNLKTVITVSVLTFIGYLAVYYFRSFPTVFNLEEFLFLSILATEEETLFRGILLGLMMSYLNQKRYFIKYPSALLSGIIFGLYHGNFYNFDYIHIITNCIFGYIVGWITIKTKSIFIPIILHTLIILFGYLLSVVKT